jgi:threonine/homoserine/homoserine lactone efflux protein
MTTGQALMAFTFTAGLLTITPGLDTALVLRTALIEGRRRALLAGAGICSGLLLWALIVSLGLGALLASSKLAYNVLRIAGAGYLFYLGGKLLSHRLQFQVIDVASQSDSTSQGSRIGCFLRGFFTNILNPKVGIFYVSFLPQFIPAKANVVLFSLVLAAIHAAEGLCWFLLLASATKQVAPWLRRPALAAAVEKGTGAIFIAFGLRLVAEQNP